MPRLELEEAGARRIFPISEEQITIGRAQDNTIICNDKKASRNHAVVRQTPVGFEIIDLETGNGTRVNGEVIKRKELKDGDKIQIGDAVLTYFEADVGEPDAQPAKGDTGLRGVLKRGLARRLRAGKPNRPRVIPPAPRSPQAPPAPGAASPESSGLSPEERNADTILETEVPALTPPPPVPGTPIVVTPTAAPAASPAAVKLPEPSKPIVVVKPPLPLPQAVQNRSDTSRVIPPAATSARVPGASPAPAPVAVTPKPAAPTIQTTTTPVAPPQSPAGPNASKPPTTAVATVRPTQTVVRPTQPPPATGAKTPSAGRSDPPVPQPPVPVTRPATRTQGETSISVPTSERAVISSEGRSDMKRVFLLEQGRVRSFQRGAKEGTPPPIPLMTIFGTETGDLLPWEDIFRIENNTPLREMGAPRGGLLLAASEGQGEGSPILIDTAGMLTLVELVDEASDPKAHSRLIGKAVNFAATCALEWTAETLQKEAEAFASRNGRPAAEVLHARLGKTPGEDFWRKVETNLQAGRVRTIFVVREPTVAIQKAIDFVHGKTTLSAFALQIEMYVERVAEKPRSCFTVKLFEPSKSVRATKVGTETRRTETTVTAG